jgi:leader peptidase (prepilin peptidase)/N-methyltransferase
MMQLILYGAVGLVIGSFLNVMIDRLPAGESVLQPPSRCPHCHRTLSVRDMVPVLSYLLLRGRCRACGATIPLRVLVVELATGLLFAALWQVYGLGWPLLLNSIYASLLVVIFAIDLEHKLVLNRIILPATAFALLAIPLQLLVNPPLYSHYGVLAIFLGGGEQLGLSLAKISMISQLLGGVVAFGIFFLVWIISPRGMGAGDVKLAAFVGLITAFPGALFAVLGSFVLGGVVALLLLISGRATRKSHIPFAPFLVVTTLALLLFGDPIVAYYIAH